MCNILCHRARFEMSARARGGGAQIMLCTQPPRTESCAAAAALSERTNAIVDALVCHPSSAAAAAAVGDSGTATSEMLSTQWLRRHSTTCTLKCVCVKYIYVYRSTLDVPAKLAAHLVRECLHCMLLRVVTHRIHITY